MELSEFELKIDPTRSVWTALDWMNPMSGYTLRVYAGFDPRRLRDVTDKTQKSTLNLCIYSREVGRLITHLEDARGKLGLPNTGSKYCQGLTILVDDANGVLPLDPTKQELAFGNEVVYKENFWTWLSGVTRLYYNLHQNKFKRGEEKPLTALTAEVKRHLPTIESWQDPNHFTKVLSDCRFTRFTNVKWTRSSGLVHSIATKYKPISGVDTLARIVAPPPAPAPVPPIPMSPVISRAPKPGVGEDRRKRKASETLDTETESEDSSEDEKLYTSSIASPRSSKRGGSSSRSSASKSLSAQGVHVQRLNRELQTSFERERMHRIAIQDLNKTLESRNAENQSLKEALDKSKQEVEIIHRELQVQESFCKDLRSRLAEDRKLTLL